MGIKLSTDQDEVKEYIGKETSRFLKGLKNLNEAKRYLNDIQIKENYSIDFTEMVEEKLNSEIDVPIGGDDNGGQEN